jgi:hypothetical protein
MAKTHVPKSYRITEGSISTTGSDHNPVRANSTDPQHTTFVTPPVDFRRPAGEVDVNPNDLRDHP